MQGKYRYSRAGVLIAAVAVASLIAAGCALLVDGEARVKSIPGLSIAVFGTFLTSMAIIAAFSIEEGSRWPTPWEVLDRARVPAWFVVALGSVVTALVAGALDSSFLSTFSLTLSLAAIPLGTWALWGLIWLSSDRGRWRLVVDQLAASIVEAGSLPRRDDFTDLGEVDFEDHVPGSFLTAGLPRQPQRTGVSLEQVPGVLRAYADRRNPRDVVGLIDEVHAGARAAFEHRGWPDAGAYLAGVDALLSVQREVFAELTGRVLSGQLGDATARLAVVRAGEAFLDSAGRARAGGAEQDAADLPATGNDRLEALLARHLTAISRFAGATTQEVEGRLRHQRGPSESGASRRALLILRSVCQDLQQAIRWAVDPDPPGMKLPPDHIWRAGLSDPEAALIWLWSTVESASGPYGVGQYAACEILTGRKFYESYWDGFDVYTEIARRIAAGGEGVAAGQAALERAGGLATVALELSARRLAALPPRAHDAESLADDPAHRDDRHVACELFLAGAGFKPPGRDPTEDLAWLLTDRLHGSLWTTVADALSELTDPVAAPPLRPLHRRPDACTLSICLRLTPSEDASGRGLDPLREFLASVPDRLLEQTAALGSALIGVEPIDVGAERSAQQAAVVEACCFARRVTRGPLPGQGSVLTAPPIPTPRDLSGPDAAFAEAIAAIADGGPAVEVDIVQCDPRWLETWAEARTELDAALLAAALRGARVRRVILFTLAPDSPLVPTRLLYRWTDALATAAHCFESADGVAGSYQVRQLIPAYRDGEGLPADRIDVRSADVEGKAEFESFWARLDSEVNPLDGPGLIEL